MKTLTNLCVFLFALSASVLAASPQKAEKAETWEDRNHFPEAYSILTSDRILFPDDVSDWPLKIDSKHQLFVDDYLISDIENLTRSFHQPVKHPANPLIGGGAPGVLYDAKTGKFRMWQGWNNVTEYTSTDGVSWKKSDRGPDENLLMKESGDLRGFMYNPDLSEEEGRYKIVLERRWNEEKKEPGGFYLYHSRDGINWERRPERAILARSTNLMKPCEFRPIGAGDPSGFQWGGASHFQGGGVGDTSSFRYDTVLKRYIFDGKFNLYFPPEKIKQLGICTGKKPRLKLRTFSESEDMIHWSAPRFMLYPDRNDTPDRQIYAHVGFVYESMWIGVIQLMRFETMNWKQVELFLSYSRDGRHWLRPREREPFIPLGDGDSWDSDYTVTAFTAPVLVDDELYFYYSSTRHPKRDNLERWPGTRIGLAKLRRDGFASLDAGDTPGQVVTRPLTFKGKTLFVNADVGKDGWVKAAVLSRDSETLPGYTIDNSLSLANDTTKGRMGWKSKPELSLPGNEHLRIEFQLKNAKLYSFWIE